MSKAARCLRLLSESRLNIQDTRSFYQYPTQRLKPDQSVPTLHYEGTDVTTNAAKASLLAHLFSSAFDNNSFPSSSTDPTQARRLTQVDSPLAFEGFDTYTEFRRLKPKLSLTAGGLPPIFLKNFAIFVCEALFFILDRSHREGTVPVLFKQGRVYPVHKKGQRSDPNNYRPISRGSASCSIFEKLLVKHITPHVSPNAMLDSTYGFVRNRSTCTQLLHMC